MTAQPAIRSERGGRADTPQRFLSDMAQVIGAFAQAEGLVVGDRIEPPYRVLKAGIGAGIVRRLEAASFLERDDVRPIIADRTLERRIAQNEPLRVDEADGILRLVRVLAHAVRVFEDTALAEEWLRSPNPELDGEIPIRMAATDLGAREVEAVLTRIEHGVFG